MVCRITVTRPINPTPVSPSNASYPLSIPRPPSTPLTVLSSTITANQQHCHRTLLIARFCKTLNGFNRLIIGISGDFIRVFHVGALRGTQCLSGIGHNFSWRQIRFTRHASRWSAIAILLGAEHRHDINYYK